MKQSAFNSLKGNIWLDGLFGLEKENIRVDHSGNLAQTPHPKVFGNKLKHPFITTDFSESQIEMITPPLPDIRQATGFLETIHDIVSLELKEEYLWPQSIPPILPADQQIPIAQYGEDGNDAREYREFLAEKYGPKNQLFSGIHFNFSYSEKLLELLYLKANASVSFDEFKDEAYLKTSRQMLRLRWLYILLYGDSPVVDPSFELQCKMAPYPIDRNVIALSIRNSCFGYQNFDDLFPDYSSVTNYKDSIARMIQDQKIAAAKELYSPVRLKFIRNQHHISYLEFRFIDIDPLAKAGISVEALRFLHALALYGLLTGEPDDFSSAAQAEANKYHQGVALYGLNTAPFWVDIDGVRYNIWQKAQTIIREITDLFGKLDIKNAEYLDSLMQAVNLIENPKERKVYEVLNGIVKMGYIQFHVEKARQYLNDSRANSYNFHGLEDMELSTQILLHEAVKRGVSFEILDRKENFIRFQKDGNIQYVKQATKTSLDNYASILAMENKLVTKKILTEHGIRVPKGLEYTSVKAAKADFNFHQDKPVVIKPNQTNFGLGITILKENKDEHTYQRAVDIAFEHDTTILIEEFISGKEFRFFVIGDEVVGILHRVPANVTGDGSRSVSELIELKNQDTLRGKGYLTPLEKIQLGEAEAMFLKQQNKDFETIPVSGEVVFLRENSNISTGGDSIDFTDDIPDSYKQIAVQAAKALNVVITGLDMIIPDTMQEATTDNYAIIELNFNPAIHIHCHPFQGKNRKLNEKLMDALGY
ncbi:MAG: bifunctional glutamate--cysteine ligase GshA/glutathione synthetase GshB [Bacteroidota bacterium]|nr:bifunctional glutamate--cysteine ligase GshA/glutathione synthetase GshB [Odoribacter sp.]MDP3641798.1 bifunctional glutamate--cysteine ligase GshA/glutathione synthetase GshB [Bacteroidota bacterium]